jgi:hypothetical protein
MDGLTERFEGEAVWGQVPTRLKPVALPRRCAALLDGVRLFEGSLRSGGAINLSPDTSIR